MSFFKKSLDRLNPISNLTLVNKNDLTNLQTQNSALLMTHQSAPKFTDNNPDHFITSNARASLPLPYLDTPTGSKVPLWRLHPHRMYEMAENIGDLRAVFETIQREMFRNGLKVQSKFKYKCPQCLKEFKEKPSKTYIPMMNLGKTQKKVEFSCDECDYEGDSEEFIKPVPKNRVKLQALLNKTANNNEQTLKIVSRQYERDLDTVDGAYCVVTRNYNIKRRKDGGIVNELTGATGIVENPLEAEIDEFVRVHPVQITMIANDEAKLGVGSDNKVRWICPNYSHRENILEQPVCDKCGCEAFTAIAETNAVPFGLPVAEPKRRYYAKHELIWTAGKYMPDMLYGNSVLNAVWKKVMSLYHQDEYLWKYFDKDRPPKSLLAIGSRNYETVQSFFERQRQGARADPYMPRPVLLNTDNVGNALQYVDLTPNFKELELSNLRTELRQIISSIYGVQPVFYGEQTKAGLGNESLQVTITNRTIKWYQKFLNENFFAKIGQMVGVEDWEIVLIDSEEIDLLREEQIKGAQIDNAVKMYGMGFDVATDGNGDFVFSQFPNPERQMMMIGGQGTGQNIANGNNDKTKNTKGSKESQSNFDGEPKLNRPSDVGGAGGGSPSSGNNPFSNKSLDDQEIIEFAKQEIHRGILNNSTLTTMAKNLSEKCGLDKEKALNAIKIIISSNI